MIEQKRRAAAGQIKLVTLLALVSNIALFVLKLSCGLLAGSLALVADGVHSLSDMSTDIGVLVGVYFGSKEPDKSHPYGHGRAETFAALAISLFLIGTGAGMVYYAAVGIAQGRVVKPHVVILAVGIVSIVVKELLYRITCTAAVRFHSSAVYANAWHHRSDALSSVAVVVGFVALELGFGYGDHIAAIAVGLMIIFVGVTILGRCLSEFAERAVDTETIEHIKSIINANDQIHDWHKLRTRTVGREIFLDLHILVEPSLDVGGAHQIAESLENSLHEQLSRPVNITVHVEPDIPELRK